MMENPDDAYVILDLGSASIQVTIARGEQVAFYRSVPGGGDQLERAIAQGLKTSSDEVRLMRRAMTEGRELGEKGQEILRWLHLWVDGISGDIDNCLRYYESLFPDSELTRLIFTGGQARDTSLCRQLAERLELPAQIGDPMIVFKDAAGKSSSGELHTDLAVGIGLSLGGEDKG
jgi:Tfp pilus assembly PilM family ATPase